MRDPCSAHINIYRAKCTSFLWMKGGNRMKSVDPAFVSLKYLEMESCFRIILWEAGNKLFKLESDMMDIYAHEQKWGLTWIKSQFSGHDMYVSSCVTSRVWFLRECLERWWPHGWDSCLLCVHACTDAGDGAERVYRRWSSDATYLLILYVLSDSLRSLSVICLSWSCFLYHQFTCANPITLKSHTDWIVEILWNLLSSRPIHACSLPCECYCHVLSQNNDLLQTIFHISLTSHSNAWLTS